jgi:hypothetical protein
VRTRRLVGALGVFGALVALAAVAFTSVPAGAECVARQTYPCDGALPQVRLGTATTIEQDQPIGPAANEDSSPPYVMIALTTVLVAGGCLYLLFRRGSIAYRARQDEDRSSES